MSAAANSFNNPQPPKPTDLSKTPNMPTKYDAKNFPDEIIIEEIETEAGVPDATPKTGQRFDPREHCDIGNYAFAKFIESLDTKESADFKKDLLLVFNESKSAEEIEIYDPANNKPVKMPIYKVALPNGQVINIGEVVALAGDFFGVPDEPISFAKDKDPKAKVCVDRFEKAYKTLLEKKDEGEVVKKVVAHMRAEAKAGHSHFPFSLKLIKHRIEEATSNIRYGLDRAEEQSLKGFWHSPYFDLGIKNFDHFKDEAKKAYLIGHNLALAKAAKAGLEKNEDEKRKLLREAFLIELFACHFLTDLFAAGHIRTPRKELLNYLIGNKDLTANPDLTKVSYVNLVVAGFFAKKMHDEDSKNGVCVKIVKDARTKHVINKSIDASGDGNFYRKENKDYALIICRTVMLALKDLHLAYRQKINETVLDKELSSYIPQEDVDKNQLLHKNPLFRVEGDAVKCDMSFVQTVKQQGVEAAVYETLSTRIGLFSSRFFNVSIKPAMVGAAKKAAELEKLTEDKINDLYNGLHEKAASCGIM